MPIDRRFRDVVNNYAVRTGVRLSGPFASPRLVDAVRRAVRSWNTDDGFRATIPALDEPGWDDALDASGPYLSSALGEDLVEFVADMKREAMHVLREGGGRPVGASSTLFALPMEGDPAAIEALANDPVRLRALAASLIREGVAAPGSRVAFLPGSLTPAQMLLALPGRIRRCLNLVLDADPDGVLPDAVSSAVHALLSEAPRHRPPVPEAVDAMSARVLIGVRVLPIDPDGELPIDYFSAFMPASVARDFVDMGSDAGADQPIDGGADGEGEDPEPTPEAPELDAWLSEANAANAPVGITFALPDHWARATALTGCMHLLRRLGAVLAKKGLPPESVEALHVHLSERTVGLGAVVDGRLVGPVTVPRCLLSTDPSQLDLALSAYDAPVSYHDEENPFPALAA